MRMMKMNLGMPSSRSAMRPGTNCHRKADPTRHRGNTKKARSTAAIHVSTMGASTRAATKPRTTDGSDAIISMSGFTMALTR